MSEFRTITQDSYQKDDVLVNRADSSRTARVIQPIITKGKFTGFLVIFNTGKQGKLSKFDLEKPRCPWVKRGTTLEPIAEVSASNGQSESVTSFPIGQMFSVNEDGKAEIEPTPADRIAQLEAELKAANEQNDLKDTKLNELRNAMDDMIAGQTPSAAQLEAELAEARRLLEANHQEYNKLNDKWLTAVEEIGRQDAEIERLTESRNSAIDMAAVANSLVEERSERIAADLETALAAPHKEFQILRNATPSDMCRMEKEGWEAQHMQFIGDDNADRLNVVYFRIIPAAPTAPEPLRASASVKKVGPQMTIIQPDEIPVREPASAPTMTRAQARFANMMEEVAAVGKEAYDEAMANSPIPPFRPLSALLTTGGQCD